MCASFNVIKLGISSVDESPKEVCEIISNATHTHTQKLRSEKRLTLGSTHSHLLGQGLKAVVRLEARRCTFSKGGAN